MGQADLAARLPRGNKVKRAKRLYYPIVLAALGMGLSLPALAHDPQLSGIRILYQDDAVLVNVTTHISQLQEGEQRAQEKLTSSELDLAVRHRLHLRFDGADYTPGEANIIQDNANDLLIWQARFPRTAHNAEVLARIYPENATSRTVVTLLKDGMAFQETLLDTGHPDLRLAPAKQTAPKPAGSRSPDQGIGPVFGGVFTLLLACLGLRSIRGWVRGREAGSWGDQRRREPVSGPG